MADNIVGIKFGVAGGVNGESARLIKTQLTEIANNINLQVKVNINKNHFRTQLTSLKQELDKALGDLSIRIKSNVKAAKGGSSSEVGGGKEQVATYESITRSLEKLYQARAKLLKMPKTKDGSFATVEGAKAAYDRKTFGDLYGKQLAQLRAMGGASDELVAKITAYRSELERAYQIQKNSTAVASGEGTQYESIIGTVKKLYQVKAKLLKMPQGEDGTYSTVEGAKTSQEEADLTSQYASQLQELIKLDGAESERVRKVLEYKKLLEEAYQIQQQTTAEVQRQNQVASPTAVAKIQVKAQSLYTDNGFDKIIARSKEAKKIVDDFNNSVKQAINEDGTASVDDIKRLNVEFLEAQAHIKEIGRETDTVGNKIKEAFNSRTIQRIAQVLLLALLRALRQVYQNVKEINTAMTELQIVTRATADQMDKAARNISKSAREIGTGIIDLTNSTTVYARLGYSLNDAQKLAEKTTIYAKVAGVNVNEATTNITGIIKAFNIGADGLEAVLDQLIYIGNKFPISQAEIGEAMNNAASSLAANGNSLQESIAIVSAANTTLQNVSKSSTAVRTIAARISASTGELEELGENIDDIETFPNLAKKMRGYGIEITNANGQLLSTYEVLGRIAGQWETLDQNERAAIATMVAGTRQQAAFYSIMQNWGDAQSIVANEGEAAGALMEAQATRLDSIEGKLSQLSATWEDFSRKILESAIVKGGVTILNGLVTVLDWIMGWLPAANVAVAALSFLVLNFLSKAVPHSLKWGKQIIENIKNTRQLAKTVENLTAELNTQKQALADNTAAFNLLDRNGNDAATFEAITGAFESNIDDLDKFRTILASNYGITGANADAVVKWAQEQQRLTVQVEATTQSLSKAQKAQSTLMTTIVSGIMGVSGIFLTIANSIESNGWKIGLTVIAIVAAVVAAIVAGIKVVDTAMKTNAIFAAISLIVSAVIGLISLIKSVIPSFDNLKEKAKECKDAWKEASEELENLRSKIKEVEEELDRLNSIEKPSLTDQKDIERLTQELAILKEQENYKNDAAENLQRDAINSAEDAIDRLKKDNIDAFNDVRSNLPDVLNILNEYSSLLGDFEYGTNEKLNSYFDEYYRLLDEYSLATGRAASAWSTILSRITNKDAVEALREFANTYEDTSKITGDAIKQLSSQKPEVSDFFDYLQSVGMWDGRNWDNLTGLIGELRTKLVELTSINIIDDIEALTDRFDSLSDALSDVTENGILSLGTLQTLMDKYPSLLSKYFNKSQDGYKLSLDYQDKTSFEILQDMAISSLAEYQKVLSDARTMLESLTQEDDDYETALKNLATAQDNLNTKQLEWATILREAAITDKTNSLEKLQDTLEEQLDIYKEIVEIRKDLLKTYKDEVNYQKELAKKQQSVSNLKTQLSLARLDMSAAGQARAREIEDQLKDAEEELDEYTLERAINDITAEIDNEYSEYEKFIKEQVDAIGDQIANIAQTLSNILSGVEGLTNNHFSGTEMYELGSTIAAQTNDATKRVNQATSNNKTPSNEDTAFLEKTQGDDIKKYLEAVNSGDWETADKYYSAAKSLSDSYTPPSKEVEKTAMDELAEKMTKIKGAWGRGIKKNKPGDKGVVTYNGTEYNVKSAGDDSNLVKVLQAKDKDGKSKYGFGDRDIFLYDGSLYGYLDGSAVKLTNGGGAKKNNYDALLATIKSLGIYHGGGFVGEITDLKSNEEFAKLLTGEFVSTPKQMDDFISRTLPNLINYTNSNGGIVVESPLVTIECENVNDNTLPKLEELANRAANIVANKMGESLSRCGYKKTHK